MLYLGLESINPETLKQYNKKQSPEDVKNAVKALHDHGIEVYGMFVLGSDFDTKDTVTQTREFAQSMDIDFTQFAASTPLPGTELRREMLEQDRIFNNNWDYYDLNHVVFTPKLIEPYVLQVEILDAFKKFYSFTRSLVLFTAGRFWQWMNNGFARLYVRRWERENEEYLEYLEKVAAGKAPSSI